MTTSELSNLKQESAASPSLQTKGIWLVLTVLVPIFVTAFVQTTGVFHKDRELDMRMVEIGLGVLVTQPNADINAGEKDVRGWAIKVIEKYSGVKFTEAAKKVLEEDGPLALSPAVLSTSGASFSSSNGWVAIGYLDKTPPDRNFSLPNGNPLGAVNEGLVVMATKHVNVRPDAAGWGAVSFVLEPKQCFKVSSIKTLDAAGLKQTWANGYASDC